MFSCFLAISLVLEMGPGENFLRHLSQKNITAGGGGTYDRGVISTELPDETDLGPVASFFYVSVVWNLWG